MLLGAGLALAGALEIGVGDGPLRPGRAVTVTVASVGPTVPALQVTGGAARRDASGAGWERWTVVPNEGTLELSAGSVRRRLEVVRVPESPLDVPARADGLVGSERVVIHVAGDVPPEALEVVLSEGRLVDLTRDDAGLTLVVAPDSSPFPRVVLVGIRDVRVDAAPSWVPLRLRARPRLPLVAEPGARLRVTVGERSYGPFDADAEGRIEAVIDQYPGDALAHAVLTDDLGNETRTDLPLPMPREQRLVAMVAGALVPGLRPPTVYVAAFRDDGAPLPPGEPACRTPDVDLPVTAVGRGAWAAPLPATPADAPTDLRVSCTFAGAEHTERVEVPEGVPHRLLLRTFPDEVRADFPEAELRVVLEDVRGDRIDPSAVQVDAEQGLVELERVKGDVLRGLYDGHEAVDPGSDVLVAKLPVTLGEGAAQGVRGGWARDGGRLTLYGQAVDRLGRPLRDVPLELRLDGELVGEGRTDAAGVVGTEVAEGGGPLHQLEVVNGAWRGETVVLTDAVGGIRPGGPLLEARQELAVRAGALAGINIVVDPPLLRAAPGAVAWVYVGLEDRNGLPLRESRVRVEASEGVVSSPSQRADGRWVAEYQPEPGGQVREVVITAESEGVRSSTTLAVQPRVVRMSLGPWVGAVSNFGEVGAWAAGADLDVRLRSRVVGEAAMVRLGAWGYGLDSDIPGDGELTLRGSVVPVHAALLLRQDVGRWGLWGGAGGALALHRLELRAGQDVVAEGYRGLGGPEVIGGVGWRAFGGEALLEVRGLWLDGPVGDVGWTGNLGGLAGGLGWRVLY